MSKSLSQRGETPSFWNVSGVKAPDFICTLSVYRCTASVCYKSWFSWFCSSRSSCKGQHFVTSWDDPHPRMSPRPLFLQLVAARGAILVSARLHVCLLCPAGTARTFGCTSLPRRITGSGRSRASAWQRGRGTGNLQKPKQQEVCTDAYTCAVKYVSSEETVDPLERRANRRCDLPQNCPVF